MATPPSKEKLLIQVLRKIPIFNGLSPSQVKKILGLCQNQTYKPGERVCESGSSPDEMFVLLSGELAIITAEGLKVATILPVTTVGEMGVITGQPRVASVEVSKPAALFMIQKAQFDAVLREDQEMQAAVYRAIIDDEPEFRVLVKDAPPDFDVVAAENGRHALELVQEFKLDLVITDINMPELDGGQLLENLRAQFPPLKCSGHVRLCRRRTGAGTPI